MVAELPYIVGIDIGGTKIAAALMSTDGKIIQKSEVPSDATDKEKMFQQVVKSIEEVLGTSQVRIEEVQGMGVGVAGKVDRKNGIAVYQNNLPWQDFPLKARLKEYFSIDHIVIENDVTMAAFAEWQAANATDEETFVYLTVSTGISCATIYNGQYMGGSGFSGEIGLFPVLKTQSSTLLERLEQVSSGPAIQHAARGLYGEENLTTSDFFLKYLNEDGTAKKILEEVVEALAHGIYSIVCLVDPHKIVIGGGVFNHQPYLLALVKTALEKYLIPEQMDVLNRLQLSVLKGNAGVVGAGVVSYKEIDLLTQ